jgi:hypothetical protein
MLAVIPHAEVSRWAEASTTVAQRCALRAAFHDGDWAADEQRNSSNDGQHDRNDDQEHRRR